MSRKSAEEISLKCFLNAYLRESKDVYYEQHESQWVAYCPLESGLILCVFIKYYSASGRHQFSWPAFLFDYSKNIYFLHSWLTLGFLMEDLTCRHPAIENKNKELLHRFFNSYDNLTIILNHWPNKKLETLFACFVNFELSEQGLLSGHAMHPTPKSRGEFTPSDFKQYSPELGERFQLHYFLADHSIVSTDSALLQSAQEIVKKYCLEQHDDEEGVLLPLHPWQANYIQHMPIIKQWLKSGKLIDKGRLGKPFSATSSVRTVYNPSLPWMLKFSLNVSITNSVRTQFEKELVRGVAAHRFWASSIGAICQLTFPQFIPITDPAYMYLRDGEHCVHETTALLRMNPWKISSNVTSLATLCQDHPFENKNRFHVLIDYIATNKNLTREEAVMQWFDAFLKIAIEPLLWIFITYGVAMEAHQQNLLLELEDGWPIKSYYRDNQGYYVVDNCVPSLNKEMDPLILQAFCQGTPQFIQHHFVYYLICNSVFGVINALGTTGFLNEKKLFSALYAFLNDRAILWESHFLKYLLESDMLPFKGNLLTRVYGLDELLEPLETQSVYIDIHNPIKMGAPL